MPGRCTPPIPDRLSPQWPISALTRVPLVARRGMHDEPGRLVDDDQMLVLVGDIERDAPRHAAPGLRRRARQRDRLAGPHLVVAVARHECRRADRCRSSISALTRVRDSTRPLPGRSRRRHRGGARPRVGSDDATVRPSRSRTREVRSVTLDSLAASNACACSRSHRRACSHTLVLQRPWPKGGALRRRPNPQARSRCRSFRLYGASSTFCDPKAERSRSSVSANRADRWPSSPSRCCLGRLIDRLASDPGGHLPTLGRSRCR